MSNNHHQFTNDVAKIKIKIYTLDTKNRQADMFTKTLPKPIFEKLRKLIMGW